MTSPESIEKVGSFYTVTHGGHQFPTSLVTHYFPLDALIVSQLGQFVKGFFIFFSRGSTRLLLRLSLRDTHLAVALPGLSP